MWFDLHPSTRTQTSSVLCGPTAGLARRFGSPTLTSSPTTCCSRFHPPMSFVPESSGPLSCTATVFVHRSEWTTTGWAPMFLQMFWLSDRRSNRSMDRRGLSRVSTYDCCRHRWGRRELRDVGNDGGRRCGWRDRVWIWLRPGPGTSRACPQSAAGRPPVVLLASAVRDGGSRMGR